MNRERLGTLFSVVAAAIVGSMLLWKLLPTPPEQRDQTKPSRPTPATVKSETVPEKKTPASAEAVVVVLPPPPRPAKKPAPAVKKPLPAAARIEPLKPKPQARVTPPAPEKEPELKPLRPRPRSRPKPQEAPPPPRQAETKPRIVAAAKTIEPLRPEAKKPRSSPVRPRKPLEAKSVSARDAEIEASGNEVEKTLAEFRRRREAAARLTVRDRKFRADAAAASRRAVDQAAKLNADASRGETVVDRNTIKEGRTLLRILEHGAGPAIEIAWPDSGASRDRLYERFRACYGMRVALMDKNNQLFVAGGKKGVPWQINMDRYSGFVRQSVGLLAIKERRETRTIRDYHRILLGASPVRVFPRQVDAMLIGGLRRIIGAGYAKAANIRASYVISGNQIFIDRITVDGRIRTGKINLTRAQGRCSA